jgi:hypothetical protein
MKKKRFRLFRRLDCLKSMENSDAPVAVITEFLLPAVNVEEFKLTYEKIINHAL